MRRFNAGVDLEQMADALDPGLRRAIIRVLAKRVGRANAISKRDLLYAVSRLGMPTQDRQMRLVINDLRKEGVMICSTGGVDGGYWIAKDAAELDAYLNAEVWSRVNDLKDQAIALQEAGVKAFGGPPEGMQLSFTITD